MEKEGLVRSVNLLKKKGFKVGTFVSDRHKQIAKWVRENMAATNHHYDIWHMAKCKFTSHLIPVSVAHNYIHFKAEAQIMIRM